MYLALLISLVLHFKSSEATFGDCDQLTLDACLDECLCGFCEDPTLPEGQPRCAPAYVFWAGVVTRVQEPFLCQTGWKVPNVTQTKECTYKDATITVRWLSICLLPVLTILWGFVSVILYQERYMDKHKAIFATLRLSSENVPTLVINFFLFIPLMINLVLAINKHPDANQLFSRIFIIAVVSYDTKSAIDKTLQMSKSLFIFNFVALGITQCLLILPPISPPHAMTFVGAAITLVLLVEAVDILSKYNRLTRIWEKCLLFFALFLVLLSIILSIAAGIFDHVESVLTISATITALGYSSCSTWITQIVHFSNQSVVTIGATSINVDEDNEDLSDYASGSQ